MPVFRPSDEERKRQALANFYLQNNTQPLEVKKPVAAPKLAVTKQPQTFKVSVDRPTQPTVRVATPFLKPQPQKQQESFGQFVTRKGKEIGSDIIKTPKQFVGMVGELGLTSVDLARMKMAQSRGDEAEVTKIYNEINKRLASKDLAPGFKSVEEGKKSFIEGPNKAKSALGAGLELGSYAIGGPSVAGTFRGFKMGGKEGLKQAAKFAAPQAVAGATGNVGHTLAGTPDASAKELLLQGTIGGVAGPVIGFGLGGFGYGISAAIGKNALGKIARSKNSDEIAELIKNKVPNATDEEIQGIATKLIDEDTIEGVSKILDEFKTTEAPSIATEADKVSDELATQIAKTSRTEDAKLAIRALLPDLPDNEVENISKQLAKTKDPEEVKQIIVEARARADKAQLAVQQNTPTGQPVDQATQQTQAVQEAAIPVAPSGDVQTTTQVPEQATATPTAVEGATTASDVPGATAYTQPTKETFAEKLSRITGRAKDTIIREVYDPWQSLQQLDDDLAKSQGIKRKDASLTLADRQLTHKMTALSDATERANETFMVKQSTGESMADLFNRYRDIQTKDGSYNEFIDYLQSRFMLEIYEKSGGKVWKHQTLTPQQVAQKGLDFEAKNPTAQRDALTVKQWSNGLVDEAVRFRQLSAEEGDIIKNSYQNYVPLERSIDEDVVMPTISGGTTSVGQSKIAQRITEAAGDYDKSIESLMQRAQKVYTQARSNDMNLELFRRIKEGLIKGRILIDPVLQKARKEVLAQMEQTKKILDEAKRSRNKIATNKRLAKKDVELARKSAAEQARQYYITQAVDEAGVKFAKSLKEDELLDVFELLTTTNEIKAKRLASKLSKTDTRFKELTDNLQATRDEIKLLKTELSGNWEEAARLRQVAETGVNKVTGYIDGEKFVIEVPAEYSKTVDYVKRIKDDQLARLSGAIAAPIKVTATGLLSPVFTTVVAPIRQQAMKLAVGQGASAFGPRPMGQGFKYLFTPSGNNEVYNNLLKQGFVPEKATKVGYTVGLKSKDIASRANLYQRVKFLSTHPTKLWDSLNRTAAKLGNADRIQVAYGAYLRAKRKYPELTEEQLWAAGAKAGNEALGNFRRTSLTARRLEAVRPYSSATQAGYRALMRRFREAPIETTTKMMAILAPVALATNESINNFQDYYDQKIESGNTNEIDSNVILFLPGAHYDEETNQWNGIVKVPIAPDIKPLNRAIWQTQYKIAKGDGFDPSILAKELGRFFTADQTTNLYKENVGPLPDSPVTKLINITGGRDPYTGRPLVNEFESTQPKTEQYDKYTSEFAKMYSNSLDGWLTPKQVDMVLNQMGYPGDVLQKSDEGIVKSVIEPFLKPLIRSKGFSEKQKAGKAYSEDIKAISKTFSDPKQYQLWKAKNTKRTGGLKTNLDSANNALTLLDNREVLEAEMELNRRSAERTGVSNPLLDNTLTPEQRDRVLLYRSMKAPNAAKQNYTKAGESAYVSLGLDEKWYQDFKAKEDAFYDSITEDGETTFKTFSGAQKPQASLELQAKLDYYYTLPKGTGDRSRFLRANQDVLDFWALQNDFTNEERAALGFKPLTEDDKSGGTGKFGYGKSGTKTLEDKLSPNLSEFISTINIGKAPEIAYFAPRKVRFKVKLPKSSKAPKIRLQ